MTTDELHEIETIYQTARDDLEQLREIRNLAVRQAAAEGWTHQQIADATGLTRGRITQIITAGGNNVT